MFYSTCNHGLKLKSVPYSGRVAWFTPTVGHWTYRTQVSRQTIYVSVTSRSVGQITRSTPARHRDLSKAEHCINQTLWTQNHDDVYERFIDKLFAFTYLPFSNFWDFLVWLLSLPSEQSEWQRLCVGSMCVCLSVCLCTSTGQSDQFKTVTTTVFKSDMHVPSDSPAMTLKNFSKRGRGQGHVISWILGG